jgi:hypothetical protein
MVQGLSDDSPGGSARRHEASDPGRIMRRMRPDHPVCGARRPGVAGLCGLVAVLIGCSPSLNWRDVRAAPSPLSLRLPCKPDQGSRTVPFAGRDTPLHLVGCDAAGITFAAAHAEVAADADVQAVLRQWMTLTLSHVKAQGVQEQPARVANASLALRVRASGRRADGSPVHTEALYFAQGRRVYQAVMYAPADTREAREAADTFLSSLKLP